MLLEFSFNLCVQKTIVSNRRQLSLMVKSTDSRGGCPGVTLSHLFNSVCLKDMKSNLSGVEVRLECGKNSAHLQYCGLLAYSTFHHPPRVFSNLQQRLESKKICISQTSRQLGFSSDFNSVILMICLKSRRQI